MMVILRILTVLLVTAYVRVRCQCEESLYVNTTGQVTRLEDDRFLEGNILYSESAILKTTNGSSTRTVAGTEEGDLAEPSEFSSILGFCQSPSGDVIYVVDSDKHCVRAVNRASNQTSDMIGVCGEPGYVNGDRLRVRLRSPSVCIYDEYEDKLLVADAGNSAIRSYSFETQEAETYLQLAHDQAPYTTFDTVKVATYWKLSNDSVPITSILKDAMTKDIYVYTTSETFRNIYKISRSTSLGHAVRIAELYSGNEEQETVKSPDLLLIDGNLVTAVESMNRSTTNTRIQIHPHGLNQISCNFTIETEHNNSGKLSLLVVGTNLFIGRGDTITRVSDVDERLNCRASVGGDTPSKISIITQQIGVEGYANVLHIESDKEIPGNLLFSDHSGIYTVNKTSSLADIKIKDSVHLLPSVFQDPEYSGFVQLDDGRILVTRQRHGKQIELFSRDGNESVFTPSMANMVGDIDGEINTCRLYGPAVIIKDISNPEKFLFTDGHKIKSINLSTQMIQTEYELPEPEPASESDHESHYDSDYESFFESNSDSPDESYHEYTYDYGEEEITRAIEAFAQHPVTGDLYFTAFTTRSQSGFMTRSDSLLQRLAYGSNDTQAEYIGTIPRGEHDVSLIRFTKMIFLEDASKVMILAPHHVEETLQVHIYNITQPAPAKVTCNFEIAEMAFWFDNAAAGLYLDSGDTLYIGSVKGITKIPNYTDVLRKYCPDY